MNSVAIERRMARVGEQNRQTARAKKARAAAQQDGLDFETGVRIH